MSVSNHDRWNVPCSAEPIDWCNILHCCPILMMCTPAAVSQVFCNTAHGCGLGSLRSFLWWSWGSEMLSLLCYQCSRSMWVCCLCGHQGTWQKWKFWDSAVEVMLCLYWSSFPCEVLAFSVCLYALTLLVGHQEQHLACKNLVMRCWCGYLSGASCRLFAYVPADATATPKPYRLASFKSTLVLPFWYRLTQVS